MQLLAVYIFWLRDDNNVLWPLLIGKSVRSRGSRGIRVAYVEFHIAVLALILVVIISMNIWRLCSFVEVNMAAFFVAVTCFPRTSCDTNVCMTAHCSVFIPMSGRIMWPRLALQLKRQSVHLPVSLFMLGVDCISGNNLHWDTLVCRPPAFT